MLGHKRRRWSAEPADEYTGVVGKRLDEIAAEAQGFGALICAPEEQAEIDQRADVVQAELERGHHAEVAAAAPHRPEEVGVLLLRRRHDPAVRRHQLDRDQAVDGQARFPHQPAQTAPKRQSGDPGVADEAAGDGQPMGLGRPVQISPGGAATANRAAIGGIDHDIPHRAQVDH